MTHHQGHHTSERFVSGETAGALRSGGDMQGQDRNQQGVQLTGLADDTAAMAEGGELSLFYANILQRKSKSNMMNIMILT